MDTWKRIARWIGLFLVGLGLLVFAAFYLFGFMLGGPMVFLGGIFWEPLIVAAVGAALAFWGKTTPGGSVR